MGNVGSVVDANRPHFRPPVFVPSCDWLQEPNATSSTDTSSSHLRKTRKSNAATRSTLQYSCAFASAALSRKRWKWRRKAVFLWNDRNVPSISEGVGSAINEGGFVEGA